MEERSIAVIIIVVLVVALIAYAIWRNTRVKFTATTNQATGETSVALETQRKDAAAPAAPATTPPAATFEAGKVSNSAVTNQAPGAASMKVEDITGSTVKNIAGQGDQAR